MPLSRIRKIALLFSLLCLSATVNAAPEKPNIIFILVDDKGYSDVGCYGIEIPTPNLYALAESRQQFTQI